MSFNKYRENYSDKDFMDQKYADKMKETAIKDFFWQSSGQSRTYDHSRPQGFTII